MGIANAMHLGIRAAHAIQAAIDGEQHALSYYEEHVEKIFAAYLLNWRATYAMEGRWPNAPFWLRRR
jgi:flavin-dependent dehydrogenase